MEGIVVAVDGDASGLIDGEVGDTGTDNESALTGTAVTVGNCGLFDGETVGDNVGAALGLELTGEDEGTVVGFLD